MGVLDFSPRQSRRSLMIESISCEALLTCEIMPFG
jgi:hypothetical protein